MAEALLKYDEFAVLADLGSGYGGAIFPMVLGFPNIKVRGIEIVQSLHQRNYTSSGNFVSHNVQF